MWFLGKISVIQKENCAKRETICQSSKFDWYIRQISTLGWLSSVRTTGVTTSSQLKGCPWSASTANFHLILHVCTKYFTQTNLACMYSCTRYLNNVSLRQANFEGQLFLQKKHSRLQRWSIFRAMQCQWFIFQQRCDTDYFWKFLTSPS